MNQLGQITLQSVPSAGAGDSAAAGMNTDEQESVQGALLLLDNRPLRRAGLERLLAEWAARERLAVIAAGATSSDQLEEMRNIRLVLLSIGSDPIPTEVIRDISQRLQNGLIVLLCDRDGKADVVAAFRAGARGYMTSYTNPVLMLHALKFILDGGVFFPPEALHASEDVASTPLTPQRQISVALADVAAMTLRQERVLQHLRRGMSNKEIGRALGMCEATVKVHVRQIMRKLGVTNRTQVALIAHAMSASKDAADLAVVAEQNCPALVP